MYKTSIIILILLSSFAVALEQNLAQSDVDNFVSVYNQNIEKVPKMAIKLFGNEKMNVYVDNELALGVIANKGRIVSTQKNGVQNPTMNVYLSQETLGKLISRELSFGQAVSTGAVKYEGVVFTSKIKAKLMSLLKRFL